MQRSSSILAFTTIATVVRFEVGEVELDVVLIDNREWYVCPVRGHRCGRVLVDLGAMGLDALDWHVRSAHQLALSIRPDSTNTRSAKQVAQAPPDEEAG